MSRRRPPQYDLPKTAPEPLRLVQKLLNTRDAGYSNEWLGTPRELTSWLDENGMAVGRVTSADVDRVQRVREALRRLVIVNNHGGEVEAGERELLDAEAESATAACLIRSAGARAGGARHRRRARAHLRGGT